MVLPFGLTSAPYIFTKIMRCLVKKWRLEGIEIVVYLDDGLGMGPNVQKAQQLAHKIRSDIGLAGFVANETKSQWQPKLSCQWLCSPAHFFGVCENQQAKQRPHAMAWMARLLTIEQNKVDFPELYFIE